MQLVVRIARVARYSTNRDTPDEARRFAEALLAAAKTAEAPQ